MNYIGSKRSLLSFLSSSIFHITGLSSGTFIDGFAGTGAVGKHFQEQGFSVIANDIQYYSTVINKGKLTAFPKNNRLQSLIEKCNALEAKEGFIFENYSLAGTKHKEHKRQYFSDENAKKIDAIRQFLETERSNGTISENEYFYLLYCLLEAADKVANTASVYGAFLKHLKKSAQKLMVLHLLPFGAPNARSSVFSSPLETLISSLSADILYLDPPYNTRQYAPNYHILETIARYDNPTIYGKTGLRHYADQKSDFCVASKVANALEHIVKSASVSYVFLSYNNEGLLSENEIQNIFQKYGNCGVVWKKYSRFKADKTENRTHKAQETVEFLHWLQKR